MGVAAMRAGSRRRYDMLALLGELLDLPNDDPTNVDAAIERAAMTRGTNPARLRALAENRKMQARHPDLVRFFPRAPQAISWNDRVAQAFLDEGITAEWIEQCFERLSASGWPT